MKIVQELHNFMCYVFSFHFIPIISQRTRKELGVMQVVVPLASVLHATTVCLEDVHH